MNHYRKQPDFWIRGSGKAVLRTITPEGDDHERLVTFLRFKKCRAFWFYVPNGFWVAGASRSELAKAWIREERRGARKGMSDLVFVWADETGRHILLLELKREGGVQSEAQKRTAEDAQQYGAEYIICHGYDEAVTELTRRGLV